MCNNSLLQNYKLVAMVPDEVFTGIMPLIKLKPLTILADVIHRGDKLHGRKQCIKSLFFYHAYERLIQKLQNLHKIAEEKPAFGCQPAFGSHF